MYLTDGFNEIAVLRLALDHVAQFGCTLYLAHALGVGFDLLANLLAHLVAAFLTQTFLPALERQQPEREQDDGDQDLAGKPHDSTCARAAT